MLILQIVPPYGGSLTVDNFSSNDIVNLYFLPWHQEINTIELNKENAKNIRNHIETNRNVNNLRTTLLSMLPGIGTIPSLISLTGACIDVASNKLERFNKIISKDQLIILIQAGGVITKFTSVDPIDNGRYIRLIERVFYKSTVNDETIVVEIATNKLELACRDDNGTYLNCLDSLGFERIELSQRHPYVTATDKPTIEWKEKTSNANTNRVVAQLVTP